MYVFVYGTLKRGEGNHRLLVTSKYIGNALSYEKYALFDGGFPFAVHEDNWNKEDCLPVFGELYDVDKNVLADLDALEGEGTFYHRKRRMFTLSDTGEMLSSFIYEYGYGMARPLCETIEVGTQRCYEWRRK